MWIGLFQSFLISVFGITLLVYLSQGDEPVVLSHTEFLPKMDDEEDEGDD